MTAGIYCWQNKVNGKCYVGQSTDIKLRKRGELAAFRRSDFHNKHFQAAWDKYGADSFTWEILQLCPVRCLNCLETMFVAIYRSSNPLYGYNKTKGGHRCTFSDEARAGMAAKARKRQSSEEYRDGMRQRLLKRHVEDPEIRVRQSAAITAALKARIDSGLPPPRGNKGKKFTTEHKQKIAASSLARYRTLESREQASIERCRVWEVRKAALASQGGYHITLEHRQKVSETAARKREHAHSMQCSLGLV